MCGRTGLSLDRQQVQCACSYKPLGCNKYVKPDWLPEHNDGKEYTPSYNIAPTDITPVLVSSSRYKSVEANKRILKPMMWGIIPPWHKGDYKTHNLSTNNCRLENIKGSKLYSPILNEGGRCVVVVEGFYEWQTTKSNKRKQPYYIYEPQDDNIRIDDPSTWNNSYNEDKGWSGIKLLYMAGLYNVWQREETIIYSYSIITMDSNNTLDWLHHRMPAVLSNDEQIQAWLDIDAVNPDMALAYLNPVKVLLSWHPVSTDVNNSRNKSNELNKRVDIEKKVKTQKTLSSWFTKTEKRKCSDEQGSDLKKFKN